MHKSTLGSEANYHLWKAKSPEHLREKLSPVAAAQGSVPFMKTPKSVVLMGHPDLCILSFNLIESFVETGETKQQIHFCLPLKIIAMLQVVQ